MKRVLATFVLTLVVVLVAGLVTYAQEVHKVVADIPNAFSVAGKQLPAGRYEFELPEILHKTIIVRSLDGKNSATALIVTEISAGMSKESEPRVVFDVAGAQYILSEAWFPGHEGFLITGFKNDSEHKHSAVKVNPAKP
jgi:hypothetical protein